MKHFGVFSEAQILDLSFCMQVHTYKCRIEGLMVQNPIKVREREREREKEREKERKKEREREKERERFRERQR
jgi:hypothetical protein